MALFGCPGQGFDNNYSNLVPQRYNLSFLDSITSPVAAVSCAGTPPPAPRNTRGQATEDVLRSVKNPQQIKKNTRAVDQSTIDTLNATLGNSQAATTYLNAQNNLDPIVEPSQGIFAGSTVNNLVGSKPVPIEVSAGGDIFGGVCTDIIPKRINQLNGFGYTVNSNMYTSSLNAPGTPRRPIIENNFYIRYGPAAGSYNVARNLENAETGTEIYGGLAPVNQLYSPWSYLTRYAPTGTPYLGTQRLSLYVNNMPGRTIYLTRSKDPYYFHLPPTSTYAESIPPDVDTKFLERFGGMYFTMDPVGGGPWNDINVTSGQGTTPPLLLTSNTPAILTSGNVISIIADNTWPDVCFYQCTAAPFMGGMVITVGSYNIGAP